MSKEYTPFPIANFRSSFNESVEAWLLPRDAFQVLENMHLYRGVMEKISGYDSFTKMSYRSYVNRIGAINGVNKSYTFNLTSPISTQSFVVFGVTSAGTSSEVFTYASDGTPPIVNLVGSAGGTGTIDFTTPYTPVVNVTFNTAPPNMTVGAVQYNAVWIAYDSPVNNLTASGNPIMGIRPYFMSNGGQEVLIFDTRRMGKVVNLSSLIIQEQLALNFGVQEVPHQETSVVTTTPAFNNASTTFAGTITGQIVPGRTVFTLYNAAGALLVTATDTGFGTLTGTGVSSGFINYLTGEWIITFTSPPASTSTLNVSEFVYGNTFTGNASNFFVVANYTSKAFITNNNDLIRYYDGELLYYLNTNLSTKLPNVISYDITKCLHVEVNRERLLLVAPTVNGVDVLNTIYWSEAGNPLNFTNNENLPAPTSQRIYTFKIINTDMIVRFANSERVFRYTGDAFSPFRWDSTNNVWQCDSFYGSINYDSYYSSVGKPAIVASDGVNVKRADEIIPDFTDPYRIDQQTPALFLNQTNINQCYGERFDDLKEGWLCYNSVFSSGNVSDSVLAYNYMDETYATYTFPLSCLGYGSVINVPTWGNDFREWISIEDAWGSFNLESNSLVDLGGDQFGNVYKLDEAFTQGAYKLKNVEGVSSSSPALISCTGHGLSNGDQIIIQQVQGPAINNIPFVVTVVDANTFSVPIDTTVLFPYAGGGVFYTLPVVANAVTKDFNPFIEQGEMARLGYVDFLVSSNVNSNFRVQFYKDNELTPSYNTFYQESKLSLVGTGTKVWKRIYVGAVAKFHTFRIYQALEDFTSETINQPVRIHGFTPYFKAAGQIF